MVPPSLARLSVRALTKRYGAVEALRGVSFKINAGEIFGLLGSNGAGKTTTLECILGLRRPDSGTIHLGEIDVLAQPDAAKELLGAQIQSASLQDLITPRQALRLFAAFYRRAAPVERMIEQFGLQEKANAPFSSLSGGQKQRLFLALAFVNQPSVLLLDEPTVSLDPQSRHDVHRAIADLRSDGRAVLLCTHYLDEAQQLCDRIGILEAGRIVAVGTATELIARSSALPQLIVRTARILPTSLLAALPDTQVIKQDDVVCRLSARNANATIAALVKEVQNHSIDLLELNVQQPSLEDVFIELTGRAYSPDSDKVKVVKS